MAVNAIYAEVTFTVKPPTRVYEGDKFPVTFKLTNADGSDLKVAQINGCTLLYGPSTSTSQSYQVINGKAYFSLCRRELIVISLHHSVR